MKSPFKDFQGNEINEGDLLRHPSGESGIVQFIPRRGNDNDCWVVNYGDGTPSRLCLQINERSQGVIVE